jgi:hypothetical protein
MNLCFSLFTTGPDPARHEVLQIGGAIFDTDFVERVSQFGAFVRPAEPAQSDKMYLRRAGFRSIERLKERSPFMSGLGRVWEQFQAWCLRNTPYGDFGEFCEEVAWVGHRLHEDLWFLTESYRRHLSASDPFTMRQIRTYCDLSSVVFSYEQVARYRGISAHVGRDLQSIASFFKVRLRDEDDPTSRAVATGRIFHKHLRKQKEVFDKGTSQSRRY